MKAEKSADKEKEYLREIDELKHKNDLLQKVIALQEKEIDALYIDSRSIQARSEKGIKDNAIKLAPGDKKLSKSVIDIKKSFPGLFDD